MKLTKDQAQTLGYRVKKHLDANGMSKSSLQNLGFKWETLSNMLDGKAKQLRAKSRARLEKLLGEPIAHILGGDAAPAPRKAARRRKTGKRANGHGATAPAAAAVEEKEELGMLVLIRLESGAEVMVPAGMRVTLISRSSFMVT